VRLVWRPAEDLPSLTFDPDALHRAILNVVTNAIDACEKADEGCVEIWTGYNFDEGSALVAVRDNGEGIPEEDLRRIFSVFESRKGSRGTGLGLPVSQKILREHGGDIRVESVPDAGSTFFLEFPAVVANPATVTIADFQQD
jgi:two-component system, NtrC family, sensor kinase